MDERENQIIDIDGYVHIVNGKVVCFEPDVLDIWEAEEMDELKGFLSGAFTTDDFPPIYGENTMIVICKNYENQRRIASMENMECLPEDVLERVRSLIRERNVFSRTTNNCISDEC